MMRYRCGVWLLSLIVILLGAVSGDAVEAPAEGDSVMVVSAHPLATEIGLQVLRDGGTAVDASIAVAFALAVCEPYASGIGGGGFVMTYDAAVGKVLALDARETAPMAAHRDMYLVDGKASADLSRDGPLAVGVPGLVRGLAVLHDRLGTRPWAELVTPAVALARDGIPVSPILHDRIVLKAEKLNAAARRILMPDGIVPPVGTTLVQTDLAQTLQIIADEGADAFYSGPLAEALADAAQSGELGMTREDLAGYRPRWREPIVGAYHGLDVYSMPPPSSGGVHLIQMLNILSGFDLVAAGFGSARSCHLLTEAMKFAYADRSRFLGDTDFIDVPVARLIDPAYAAGQRARIRETEALPVTAIEGAAVVPAESDETTHLSIVDGAGNAVAATLTINLSFGSCLVAPGTGVFLNNEMDDFVAAPGSPNAFGLIGGEANAVAPGKRPLSSMTPTIVLRDGHVRLVSGAPGGAKIISTTLQTLVNVLDFGMDALQAVSAPRIHHQWYPRFLYYEFYGLSPDTRALLTDMGHVLQAREPMCNAQLIVIDPETDRRYGASDPRGMGLAAGF